jgi:hypothetical protein
VGSSLLRLRIAAILLLILALARGAGGVVLLTPGRAPIPGSTASRATEVGLGAGLVAVALLGMVAGWQLLRRRSRAFSLTICALAAFLAGGLMNGALLFGRPTDEGTMVNSVAAAAIFLFLWTGRRELLVGGGTAARGRP